MEPENIHGTVVEQLQEVQAPVQNAETTQATQPVATGSEPVAKVEPTELEKLEWRMSKKINREVGKRKEAEEQLALAAQHLAAINSRLNTIAPQREISMDDPQFKSPADFYEAKARQAAQDEWNKQQQALQYQAQHQQQVNQFEQAWANKVQTSGIADYVQVMTESETDFDALQKHTPDVMLAIQESDVGVELAYHLGKNPEDAQKLLGMRDINTRNRFIARIEAKIETQKSTVAKATTAVTGTTAPKPTAPATSTPVANRAPEADPLKMPTDQFAEWLLKKTQRRR